MSQPSQSQSSAPSPQPASLPHRESAGGPVYDVAIIGAGIAGTALAAILARQGQRVIVFEAKSHPRFAIGESMILETSETMRAAAEYFDVPELAYFSSENFMRYIGTSHGVKRHFSFLHHAPGQPQALDRSLQAVIPKHPHGHELHLYRQDTDAYLCSVAIGYGATVLQETPVKAIDLDDAGVTVTVADGTAYRAHFVVDAGGYRSLLAERFNLRTTDLQTHSRAIFTHMIDVPDFHAVHASQRAYDLPFSVAEGTLHHIFDGGWLWVIPFNNHRHATNPLCSVGLMLDPRRHPLRDDLSPAEEFEAFVARYPSMAAQFRIARAVRPWTRTGRIQYSATRVVGDRFALLGHAAGFIDPLFSKGLYVTFMTTLVLAHLLIEAHAARDYAAARFQPLEDLTTAYVAANDRLIANAYKSFGDYRLWRIMSVQWLLGAYTEYLKLLSVRAQARDRADYFKQVLGLRLVGGGFPAFRELEEEVYAAIEAVDPADDAAVVRVVESIQARYAQVDWMPQPFAAVLHGANKLPRTKLRPDLFDGDKGFLRRGAYRAHFFGERSMASVVAAFGREALRYSRTGLRLREQTAQDRLQHGAGA